MSYGLVEPTSVSKGWGEMAGYFIYSIDSKVFKQLTTRPTDEQAFVIAKHLQKHTTDSVAFPKALANLRDAVKSRLKSGDWYGDLDIEDAAVWDEFVYSLRSKVGKTLGIGFECSRYESVYWDCAKACVKRGATMLKEETFGHSGFRFHGKRKSSYSYRPSYSIFDLETVKQLAEQLLKIEPYIARLPDDGEGSIRQQFSLGLVEPVMAAVAGKRCIFVQTDT